MRWGRRTTEAPSATSSRWRSPLRGLAAPCVIALVAAFMVGDGHGEQLAVLASGPSGPVPAAPVTPPAVVVPGPATPGSQHVRQPASVSAASLPGLGQQTIPEPALVAYQRAAVVIDSADHGCHLDWTLLAAIGQVESDNGQVDGSHLNIHGVATPPIVGLRLDGSHGTSVVRDTDAGRLDGDRHFDHAVGPMQFLPSTWAAVAVDGDNDGTRNVQDINDAALASAVYLCAGTGDLSTGAGARAAVLRYNHSEAYVARVMAVAKALRLSRVLVAPDPQPLSTTEVRSPGRHHGAPRHQTKRHHQRPTGGHTHPSSGPTVAPSGAPSSGPSGPISTPTGGPTGGPSGGPGGGPSSGPTQPPTGGPTPTTPPVIPDPVPLALAALSAAEVEAIDDGWTACVDTLATGWAFDQMQTCLSEQLDVATDDAHLGIFLQWAVDQGLVPAPEETPSTP